MSDLPNLSCPSALAMPARPADVDPDATLSTLLDDYHRHLIAVAAARMGGGAGRDVAGHGLAALATAHAITDDLMSERRRIGVDALAHAADGVRSRSTGPSS